VERPWARVKPHLLTDRALLRAADVGSLDELWEHLQQRPFFLSPHDQTEWVRAFVETYPGGRADLLQVADAALGHEFDLLGSGPVSLGDSLPWHTDFKTGREWPLEYACSIQYAELDRPTDVKVPWELSRCQHFTALGQAYWLTGDERYAREFVAEIDDWIARNPVAFGVNWACPMDVALRAVSWIWGFYFFADAAACASLDFRGRFLRALYLHGDYIATHLEKSEVNGNHYLCDGVGLVFLGVFFGGSEKGREWLDSGRSIVIDEIGRQTTADGVDFEQSTAYHRLVLEAFATAYLLLRAAGQQIPDDAWARLERNVEAYTKPDGLAPLIGDADDGRIQKLGRQPLNDHRYLLSTGAVIFKRADLKRAAGRYWEESFWMLGPAGSLEFGRIPSDTRPLASRAFAEGGVFILRNSHAHVIVDCAEVGMRGRGGHGHNDILGFEFWMNGVNWITDCGAYLYTASREWRNRFRSTEFHNTVQIDDQELNRFLGADALWQLQYDAVPTRATLTCGPDGDRFSGGHRGYERLAEPVTISREIVLDVRRPRLAVRDRLSGRGMHRIVCRLHLNPSVTAEINGCDVRLVDREQAIWFLPDEIQGFTVSITPGWVSPSYGVKVPTNVVTWAGMADVPLVMSFLLADSRMSIADREQACEALTTG
jgi:heparinase II/III-like protein